MAVFANESRSELRHIIGDKNGATWIDVLCISVSWKLFISDNSLFTRNLRIFLRVHFFFLYENSNTYYGRFISGAVVTCVSDLRFLPISSSLNMNLCVYSSNKLWNYISIIEFLTCLLSKQKIAPTKTKQRKREKKNADILLFSIRKPYLYYSWV